MERAAAAAARRGRYYQAWGGGQGPENMYVVDPSGEAVQLDAMWTSAAPDGVAGDALATMCTQGNCLRAAAPPCAAALARSCGEVRLGKARCADCVYRAETWASLTAAGCLNRDAVSYCVGA